MYKKIGVLIITILGGALLIYSATRSLDFIGLTLPADRQVLAYFGLAALDGGVIAWLLSYLYGSRGGWQRAISVLMLMVDVIGAIAMFSLDALYNTGKSGMTAALSSETITTAVIGLSAVIGLNIIATIAHHVTDPEKLREQAEEEAFAKVEDATLKQISRNADSLASQLAPALADDWMNQTKARYMSYVGTGKIPTLIDGHAQDLTEPQTVAMPVIFQKEPKASPVFDWLKNNLFNFGPAQSRRYQATAPVVSETHSTDTIKHTSLYDGFKQGIAESQGVPVDKLYSMGDGIARGLSGAGGDEVEAKDIPFEKDDPAPS